MIFCTQLKRRADHFLFSVESVGCMAPETIVREVSAGDRLCNSFFCVQYALTHVLCGVFYIILYSNCNLGYFDPQGEGSQVHQFDRRL